MKTLLAAALLLSLLSVDLVSCLGVQAVILTIEHLTDAEPATASA